MQNARSLDDALALRWTEQRGLPLPVRLALPHVLVMAAASRAGMVPAALRDLEDASTIPDDEQAAMRASLDEFVHHQLVDGATRVAAWDAAGARHGDAAVSRTHTWMPRIGAIAPTLPLNAAYRALRRDAAGASAQLLLLWIGGEVGHRSIIMHWETASALAGVPTSDLLGGAALLERDGWVTRETACDESASAARVLLLATERARMVLQALRGV